MPRTLTSYRLFLASPGGLEAERRAVREVVARFNADHAMPEGSHFEVVGWEETSLGVGRPQGRINEESLRPCDLFLLLLHDRWGSPPGGRSRATSGSEEEFRYAERLLSDTDEAMRGLTLLFKTVPPERLADPGEQLGRVVEFRNRVEAERRHLYGTFVDVAELGDAVRRQLANWLRECRATAGGVNSDQPATPPPGGTTDDAG